jgi:hypothetical protein
MLDVLKTLLENSVVSEEFKAEIEDAWNKKIQENRDQVATELREEFAQKFEVEKTQLVEAMNSMMKDKLSEEIAEFIEDRKQLVEAKARYAKKMKKDSKKMESFVLHMLKSELTELHEDQKTLADNFGKLEEFVVAQLAKEISEFQQDKRDVVETKVRLVKEAKAQLDEVKSRFVKNAAKMVENTVVKSLSKEITQLKEDISAARENDFGRRLFEAFASEYTHSYLNEKGEVAKMLRIIEQKNQQIQEAKQIMEKTTKLIENKDREIARAKDAATRKEVLSELLSPLAKEKRAVMSNLLESVDTAKLRSSFDKYLPAVMTENKVTKQALVEAKEITGNKSTNIKSDVDNNIVDIRRLAGLR